ncbi:hypothetical protein H0H93_016305 [Arthromyces matolae]|nr:hypothetical protein H0H93_016305 [Arthromyces matolae]
MLVVIFKVTDSASYLSQEMASSVFPVLGITSGFMYQKLAMAGKNPSASAKAQTGAKKAPTSARAQTTANPNVPKPASGAVPKAPTGAAANVKTPTGGKAKK